MNFLYRLGYYLGGFSVGLVLLFFIFNGKRTQCHYGPQDRVIDNLSNKVWGARASVQSSIALDSVSIARLLKGAKVDFSMSDTRLDSCKIYILNSVKANQNIQLKVENCAKKVTVLSVKPLN